MLTFNLIFNTTLPGFLLLINQLKINHQMVLIAACNLLFGYSCHATLSCPKPHVLINAITSPARCRGEPRSSRGAPIQWQELPEAASICYAMRQSAHRDGFMV